MKSGKQVLKLLQASNSLWSVLCSPFSNYERVQSTSYMVLEVSEWNERLPGENATKQKYLRYNKQKLQDRASVSSKKVNL